MYISLFYVNSLATKDPVPPCALSETSMIVYVHDQKHASDKYQCNETDTNIGYLQCPVAELILTRQSEMANTSPATYQCLETFTPLKSKILIFCRDVISLLTRVVILLIDTATQEVPMKNI